MAMAAVKDEVSVLFVSSLPSYEAGLWLAHLNRILSYRALAEPPSSREVGGGTANLAWEHDWASSDFAVDFRHSVPWRHVEVLQFVQRNNDYSVRCHVSLQCLRD